MYLSCKQVVTIWVANWEYLLQLNEDAFTVSNGKMMALLDNLNIFH